MDLHIGAVHDKDHSTNLEYLVEAAKYISLNNGKAFLDLLGDHL